MSLEAIQFCTVGTSDEFQIEEAMISSSSAECADDGMH